jgi:hypothetical protein
VLVESNKDQKYCLDEIEVKHKLERARKDLIDGWNGQEGLTCGERAKHWQTGAAKAPRMARPTNKMVSIVSD